MMRFKITLVLLSIVCSIAACRLVPAQQPEGELFPTAPADIQPNADTQAESPAKATPVADSPAAGICAEFEGQLVTITINPDMPSPRCAQINSKQVLEVVNNRGETLHVKIGVLEAMIEPGNSHNFGMAFGDYLLPGVHRIEVDPCCGAELWLQDGE